MVRDVNGRPVRDYGRDDHGKFAANVQSVAAATETKPFKHKAAIADVYDNYGKKFADAGPMDSFKQRLLQAHDQNLISMLPMDQPGSMDAEKIKRSRVQTQDGPMHFIDRRPSEGG